MKISELIAEVKTLKEKFAAMTAAKPTAKALESASAEVTQKLDEQASLLAAKEEESSNAMQEKDAQIAALQKDAADKADRIAELEGELEAQEKIREDAIKAEIVKVDNKAASKAAQIAASQGIPKLEVHPEDLRGKPVSVIERYESASPEERHEMLKDRATKIKLYQAAKTLRRK